MYFSIAFNSSSDKSTWWDDKSNIYLDKLGVSNMITGMETSLMNMQYSIECSNHGSKNEAGDLIKKLNPAIDPVLSDRNKIPFSSGGFNRKAIWNLEEIDLSEYAGKDIRVKFRFNTVDSLYNEFRGWMIDDFKIIDNSKLNK